MLSEKTELMDQRLQELAETLQKDSEAALPRKDDLSSSAPHIEQVPPGPIADSNVPLETNSELLSMPCTIFI